MDDVNGVIAVVSAIFGGAATVLTMWIKGRNDMNALVDQRLRLMLEREDKSTDRDAAAIERLEARCEGLERALIEERRECDEKIETMRREYREEIAILRSRVEHISEVEE